MMQHLLRRLVFDVPLLNEHAKMPLKVSIRNVCSYLITGSSDFSSLRIYTALRNAILDFQCWKVSFTY